MLQVRMKMEKSLIVLLISLLIITPALAAMPVNPSYVSPTGSGSACTEGSPCALSYANANADDDDVVYVTDGNYTITSNGIDPTNSGSSGHPITFQAAGSSAIFKGSAWNSRAINLSSDSYIKIRGILFKDMGFGAVIHAGGYNEISHCTFLPRDVFADVVISGTAKNDESHYYQSNTTLYDTVNDLSGYPYYRVFNATDKSHDMQVSSATADTLVGAFVGGINNYWSYGDSYVVTHPIVNDPAFIDIGGNSTHNWIHHCTSYGWGAFVQDADAGTTIQIGTDRNISNETNSNNTIEFCHFYAGGHHVMGINSGFNNVIRGNYIHNEGWYDDSAYCNQCAQKTNGVCGYRLVSCAGNADYTGDNLFESNHFGYGAQYGGPHEVVGGSGGGFTLSIPDNIYRYNAHFANVQQGLRLHSSVVGQNNTKDGANNRIYNNTFFANGYNWSSYGVQDEDDSGLYDNYRTHISFGTSSSEDLAGNVIVNNLLYDAFSEVDTNSGSSYYPGIYAWSQALIDANTITNNWVDSSSYLSSGTPFSPTNPLFVAPTITTPLALTLTGDTWGGYPDLSLQSGSGAIDGGTYLTTVHVDDTGSGTSLVLTDARYFQDGTWGSSLATLSADWICVGATVAAADCFQVGAINYTTNTITVADFLRADGEYVWLYKKSNGGQVLYGDAPDYGAFEYQEQAGQSSGKFTVTNLNGGSLTIDPSSDGPGMAVVID